MYSETIHLLDTMEREKRLHGFVVTKHEMENKMVTEQTHILIVTGNHVPKGHLNKIK